MRIRGLCISCLLVCVLISSVAAAQSKSEEITTRAVQGLVTNASKQPVAQAVVQLKNTNLEIRSFITQADGMYHFGGLGSDVEYQLKAEHAGISSSWKTLSVFDTKKTAIINLKLDHEEKPKS